MPLTSKIKELTLVIFHVLYYIQISVDKGVVARRRQQRRRVERTSAPNSTIKQCGASAMRRGIRKCHRDALWAALWSLTGKRGVDGSFSKASTSLNHLFVPHAYCRHSRSHICYFYCFQLIFWTKWHRKMRRCCNFAWLLLWMWLFRVVGCYCRFVDGLDDDLCCLFCLLMDFKPSKSLFVLLFYEWNNCWYVFGVF